MIILRTNKMSEAYIQDYFKVNKEQLDFINSFDFKNTDQRTFFIHLLNSTLINRGKPTPISSVLIQRKLKEADIFDLQEKGYITFSNYVRPTNNSSGKCREYLIDDTLVNAFIELGNDDKVTLQELINQPKYNAFTSKKTTTVMKSELKDGTNSIPPLLKSSMKAVKPVCDLEELRVFIKDKKAEYNKAEQDFKQGLITQSVLNRIKGRYWGMDAYFNRINGQNPVKEQDHMWAYQPAFKKQGSGRITTLAGLTNAPREMKQVAYQNIPNIYNYDLQSSQINILLQEFAACGLSSKWLEDYVNNKNSKYEYATIVGVSVDTWKICITSLVMGAGLPETVESAYVFAAKTGKLGAILQALEEEFMFELEEEVRVQKINESFNKLKEIVQPIKDVIDDWHKYLLKDYLLIRCYKVGSKGHNYINNPTGCTLDITELQAKQPKYSWGGIIAAFILQGVEAAFIHHLATIGDLTNEFRVISNEFDGLVVLGPISETTVKRAGLLSGLNNPILVEKPFN